MHRNLSVAGRWTLLLGAMALGGGSVFAQGGPTSAPSAPGAPGSLPAAVVPIQQQAAISPADMVRQSTDYINKMNDILTQVIKLSDLAKQQKDVIKLNCVDDKLVQVKQLIGIGQDANTAMHEDIARQDDADRYHQFSRLTIVNQQAQVLETEAENCIGEDLTYVGSTQVSVTVDPSVPQDNPTEVGIPGPVIERPPAASPF